MSDVPTKVEESKLKADIIKGDDDQKGPTRSTSNSQMDEPDLDVSPGQQTDGTSVGTIEQDHFPLKLHKLLEHLEKEGKSHIIGWNPDGKSFAVFRPKEFASEIMAKHFRRQSRYKSFQRQLNLYAFKRECHGHIKGVYSHELFVRNNRELCKEMKRERVSSIKSDRTSLVGSTTMRGVTSGRSSNHSEDSSSQSPGQSNRKRPLPFTAQHERDMLLASQDRVTLAMKQKLYRMTNAASEATDAPEKMKAEFYRSQSEPNFVMSALDCDNRNVSSMDQEASSISLIPTFELREGYNNTSSSSIVANYTQDDMNLTYQAPASSPPMYKLAADIHFTSPPSDVAFRALNECNNLVELNQRSQVQFFGEFHFDFEKASLPKWQGIGSQPTLLPPIPDLSSTGPTTHLRSPSNPMNSSSTGVVSRDHNRNVPTCHHLATGMNATGGNLIGLPLSSHYRTEEDDSGSIGTIDDFDNMMG